VEGEHILFFSDASCADTTRIHPNLNVCQVNNTGYP